MWFNSQIDQISGSKFKSCLRASLRKIYNFGDDQFLGQKSCNNELINIKIIFLLYLILFLKSPSKIIDFREG